MDTKALVALFTLCAIVAVGEGIKCYTCTRMEWTVFHGGEDDDECEYPVDKGADTADECVACAFDTRNETIDWVGRHCIKEEGTCTNGTFEQDTPGLDWLDNLPLIKDNPNFEVERMCCTTDLCNDADYNPDAATNVQFASGLLVAIFVSIYYNFRQ